jgi:hypothetical protein
MRSNGSSPKQRRRNSTPLLIIILLSPYIVGFSGDDSTYSAVTFAIGHGQYAQYQKTGDCSGYYRPAQYTEVNARIEHKGSFYRLGVTALAIPQQGKVFAWPVIGLDYKYFAIGTDRVRFGSYRTLYAEAGFFNAVPNSSGKGSINAGIGGRISENVPNIWIGYGWGLAFVEPGFGTEISLRLSDRSQGVVGARFGRLTDSRVDPQTNIMNTTTINETGIGIGYRYFFP